MRQPGKRFYQERWEAGEWRPGLNGNALPLFQLPALFNARADEPVYVVEGEKDAHRLATLGLVATTNAGGAGKFGRHHAEALRGRHIVVLPDNDEPGRKHANEVSQLCRDVAASVVIVDLPDLPEKGDVSDWLDDGHDAKELKALVRDFQAREASGSLDPSSPGPGPEFFLRDRDRDSGFSSAGIGTGGHDQIPDLGRPAGVLPDSRSGSGLVEVWTMPEPALRRYVVNGLVPEGAASSFYGMGGVKKSYLAEHLSLSLTIGKPWLAWSVRKGSVLYLDAELDAEEFARRAYRLARGMGLDRLPEGLYYRSPGGPLSDPAVMNRVLNEIEQVKPVLVVLDSFMAAFAGADLFSAGQTTEAFAQIARFRTTLIVDHTPRPMAGSNHSDLSPYGSVFKENLTRSVVQLTHAGDGGGVRLRQTKHNFGPLIEPFDIAFDFSEQAITVRKVKLDDPSMAGIEDHLKAHERTHLELLRSPEQRATVEDLAERTAKQPKTIQNHLTQLAKLGQAESTGDGHWQAVPIPVPKERDRESQDEATCRRCEVVLLSDEERRIGMCRACANPDEKPF